MGMYDYSGHAGTKCAVCGKRDQPSIPVIYIRNGTKWDQQRWCKTCFDPFHQQLGPDVANNVSLVNSMAARALPSRRVIAHRLAVIDKQGLTLVMEIE